MRILIVAPNCPLPILKMEGAEVAVALNAMQALDFVDGGSFDATVLCESGSYEALTFHGLTICANQRERLGRLVVFADERNSKEFEQTTRELRRTESGARILSFPVTHEKLKEALEFTN